MDEKLLQIPACCGSWRIFVVAVGAFLLWQLAYKSTRTGHTFFLHLDGETPSRSVKILTK